MLKNATYLFNQPRGNFHHSESRWCTIAQIALIYLSSIKGSELNVYQSKINQDTTKWITKAEEEPKKLLLGDWRVDNTIVEGNIKHIFGNDPIIDSQVFPNIIYKNEKSKEVKLIVVRTIGRTVRGRKKEGLDNIDRYFQLVEKIQSEGWKCDLYYLMSYGHEDEGNQCEEGIIDESKRHQDWKRLESVNAKILLWEELFSLIEDSEVSKYIDPNLVQYTLMPD
ncbi:MAG TPA: hypothetical protein EYH42_04435 [Sulfurovum sp.]|nr:hypothetical protein [Sulfurovum sp.]